MPSRFKFLVICFGETPSMKWRKIRSTIAASAGSISRSPVETLPPFNVDNSVSVAQTTGGLAVLDSATQSAMGLLGQILQEHGVHRALEPDVQVRDVAFDD